MKAMFCSSFLLPAAVAAGLVAGACGSIARDAACVQADACDQSLGQPFNSFRATDPVFGDEGRCWQNDSTAGPCIDACNSFLADTRADAERAGDINLLGACGGAIPQ
jgi:hypothetical protein